MTIIRPRPGSQGRVQEQCSDPHQSFQLANAPDTSSSPWVHVLQYNSASTSILSDHQQHQANVLHCAAALLSSESDVRELRHMHSPKPRYLLLLGPSLCSMFCILFCCNCPSRSRCRMPILLKPFANRVESSQFTRLIQPYLSLNPTTELVLLFATKRVIGMAWPSFTCTCI